MKVFKYGTGQTIPSNAQYLYSREERTDDGILVWHYFLVDVNHEKKG